MIWGGSPNCKHEWKEHIEKPRGGKYKEDNPPIVGSNKRLEIQPYRREQKSSFCSKCSAWHGQLGLEPTLDLYLDHLLQITAELKRVLKKTGVMFWNHGDCYGGSRGTGSNVQEHWQKGKQTSATPGRGLGVPKCLALQNARLLIKLVDDQGWILRNRIIWHKPNSMPSSVKDRFSNSFEPVYFLTKSNKPVYYYNTETGLMADQKPLKEKQKPGVDYYWDWKADIDEWKKKSYWRSLDYWFDLDAVRKAHTVCGVTDKRPMGILGQKLYRGSKYHKSKDKHLQQYTSDYIAPIGPKMGKDKDRQEWASRTPNWSNIKGKNPSDLWTIPTQPFPQAHFATFPQKLVEPLIKAGSPR